MNEKEKAEDLYYMFDANSTYALNCVDELINAFKQLSIEESGRVHIDFGHGYWERVKLEIENIES